MERMRKTVANILLPALVLCLTLPAWSKEKSKGKQGKRQARSSKLSPDQKNSRLRNFYEVFEDVIGDFEYDLQNGDVNGLRDLSIRNIVTSENIPPSFRNHVELIIQEKVLQHAKTRIIECLPCRSKTAKLSGGNVVISSPDSDPVQMMKIARNAGILHFMDAAFSFQPNGMILSLTTTEAESGAVVWSRSYNSETSRSAALRRGVDYNQLDEAKRRGEYVPTMQWRLIVGYTFERNLNGYSGVILLGTRVVERYDNRSKEVGFEANYFVDGNAAVGGGDSTTQSLYSGINLTMLFVHGWNFIGREENYNKIRSSFNAGIGGTYTSLMIGGLLRVGWEWRLGKHWAVSTMLGYRPPGTAVLGAENTVSVSGLEAGLGINALF